MKIRVESEKIAKAVKKLDGIEIAVDNPEDAKEAIDLIFRKTDLFSTDVQGNLKDVLVSAHQKYETSAVNYKTVFQLEFLFEDAVALDTRVSVIKELQQFFEKV